MSAALLVTAAALLGAEEVPAQEPTPAPAATPAPPVAEPLPDWSVGAGVGFTVVSTFASASVGPSSSLSAPRSDAPTASLVLERRVARRTWLLMLLRGGYSENASAPENDPGSMASLVVRNSTQSVLAALGARQSLLGDRAPVDVSAIAILSFGYQRVVRDTTLTQPVPLGEPMVTSTRGVANLGTVALGLGVAAERMLIENLALRLTLGLVKVSYSEGREVSPFFGAGTVTDNARRVSFISAGLVLEPGLELRFYF